MSKNTVTRLFWFNAQSLVRFADSGTFLRGRTLFDLKKVRALRITPIADHWLIEGSVQGSHPHPYELSIELGLTSEGRITSWEADCSCPVGFNCKHAVALTLQAATVGPSAPGADKIFSAQPSPQDIEAQRKAEQERIKEAERQKAEAALLDWLKKIDQVSGTNPHIPSGLRQNDRPERYLYLLRVVGPHTPNPRLALEAVTSYTKIKGGWSKVKPIRYPPYAGQSAYDQASPTDHEVLNMLLMLSRSSNSYNYGNVTHATLSGRMGLIALEQAASTGRMFLGDDYGNIGSQLNWGSARTLDWSWTEITTISNGAQGWALRARLRADTDAHGAGTPGNHGRLYLNTPVLYLDSERNLCGPVQVPGLSDAQLMVLLQAPLLQPAALQKHQVEVMQRLGSIPPPPLLQNLPRLEGITPRACLHIAPNPDNQNGSRGLMLARLRFDYQGHTGWWTGSGRVVRVDGPQGPVLLQRDTEAEFDAISRLVGLGLSSGEQGHFFFANSSGQQTWLRWADEDYRELRENNFDLTLDPGLDGWITHAENLDVQLQAQDGGDADSETGSDWFDLSLGMEINGQRHNVLPWLPDLIAAAANSPVDPETGQPDLPPFVYVPKPDGQGFIRLPTEPLKPWMAALLEMASDRGHDFSGDALRLSRFDAMRTTATLGAGVVWQGAQALRDMVQQLSGHVAIAPVAVPDSVQASLRPYQQQGVNWLQFLRQHGLAGILADDMGLGKTLQTLVHIQIEKDAGRLTHPALIIAPVSLMGNWQREATRFCPQLRSLVLHGKERHEAATEMDQQDIVIAPYSLLGRDRERWLEQVWHLVVLDEAQNIKNANTHAAQVVGELKTRNRLCLSGTPMENHLGEIWSLFHFLMPGFLGSQQRFTELFRKPIEKQGDTERLGQLRARVTPFMLRRTKALVASELPPKVETVMRVELVGKQADLYETIRLGMEKAVREALATKGLAKSHITILDALLKLRQVCCSPALVKLDAAQKVKSSAKLEYLMETLPEMLAEGRRILLFSQFTSMLTLIEAELAKRKIEWVKLTGQSQKRDALIEQFTSGKVNLFLISLKAGGVGLNLPQADTVIHYDPWWNPAVENQATDRAHRIGQTQSVWVVKLVAQGTIEERILALQERKAALSEAMYSGSSTRKEPLFNESDLAELLKPLG
ncbi:MAG: DEAD/DEAH box helicase [Rhodoferax sp.]|nr:DEAD/DEAH box helicase [Rhodoferax sp.]